MVLVKGEMLIDCFYRIEQTLRLFYTKVESFMQGLDILREKSTLRAVLEEFDIFWT
jgi:hypothetical protein